MSAYQSPAYVNQHYNDVPSNVDTAQQPAANGFSPLMEQYNDTPYNRKVGTVGEPRGSRPSPNSATRVYVDNEQNRKLDRVGKPIIRGGIHEVRSNRTTPSSTERRRSGASNQLDQSISEVPKESQQLQEAAFNLESGAMQYLTACVQNLNFLQIHFNELQFWEKKPIGCGGFGEVYKGTRDGETVAFKKLHYQQMSKKHKETFKDDVSILAALKHPNVVLVHGPVVEEGVMGIVMEYLPHSLYHIIFVDCNQFPVKKKKEIIGQISSALQYLHMHEPLIAHCNISSQNVLLDKSYNAKLSDFGLYTLKNATETSQSKVVRADHYSAPEVLRGEIFRSVGQHFLADVYSLSIVVFEILAEETAFGDLNIKQLEENIGRGNLRPSLPTTLTQPVENLLKCCWDADASKRPTAAEFKTIWVGIMELYKDC